MASTDRKPQENALARSLGPPDVLSRYVTTAESCVPINVCVQEINKGNHTFALMITKCHLEPNHTLNEYAFKSHSPNRLSFSR
ncbi:hypothetical protein JG688_00011826 [Phytophthora aleatoria]|uniref:Uncharacterized protein n=1 Tax=Phytophthora aleatoria TaxID=2496075 RepID=A0A8J5J3T4_9STRA|nr:hypothetical protein JG688_00011826 [Phytophthora aleatoria]